MASVIDIPNGLRIATVNLGDTFNHSSAWKKVDKFVYYGIENIEGAITFAANYLGKAQAGAISPTGRKRLANKKKEVKKSLAKNLNKANEIILRLEDPKFKDDVPAETLAQTVDRVQACRLALVRLIAEFASFGRRLICNERRYEIIEDRSDGRTEDKALQDSLEIDADPKLRFRSAAHGTYASPQNGTADRLRRAPGEAVVRREGGKCAFQYVRSTPGHAGHCSVTCPYAVLVNHRPGATRHISCHFAGGLLGQHAALDDRGGAVPVDPEMTALRLIGNYVKLHSNPDVNAVCLLMILLVFSAATRAAIAIIN